jgi:molecular chaperone GrpE
MEPSSVDPQTTDQDTAPGDGAEPVEVTAKATSGIDEAQGLKTEIADLKDRLLRAVAETENVRRRAERERTETARYAITGLARDVVVVADNLDRALKAMLAGAQADKAIDEAIRTMIEGVELTQRELMAAFERHGVRKIVPQGEPFNAHFHQAVAEIPAPGVAGGTVIEVIQPGYVIQERLIRAAMVVVAKVAPSAEPGGRIDTSA